MLGLIIWHHYFDGKLKNVSSEIFEGTLEQLHAKIDKKHSENEETDESENKITVYCTFESASLVKIIIRKVQVFLGVTFSFFFRKERRP
jgi:uncharacterized UPF0160 family protein